MFDFLFGLGKSINNPLGKGVGAGLATAAGIAATTAFGPIGVVGKVGWAVAYAVAIGTFSWESLMAYFTFSSEKKRRFDEEIDKLKRLLEEGVITKAEFDLRAKAIYEKMKG